MSYTLTDAVTDLKAQVTWLSKTVSREPLIGLVDGENTLFRLPYIPALSGSVVLYKPNGTAYTLTTDYAINHDTGEITFVLAPDDVVSSTYTAMAGTTTVLENLAKEGFDKMQECYPRALYLVASGGETYFSSDATTVVEPTLGGLLFSQNRVQLRFFHLCMRYALYQRIYEESASFDGVTRESGRLVGLQIDQSRRPQNLDKLIERLDKTLATIAATAAQNDGGDASGMFVPGAKSDDNYYNWDWWENSLQDRGFIP
ncbi:MAG: hypothetical protein WC822_06080 [Candidatus Paceibacterota bacterium]